MEKSAASEDAVYNLLANITELKGQLKELASL